MPINQSNNDRIDVLESGFLGGNISAGTTETELKVGTSILSNRQNLTIYNNGPRIVYIGPTGVTSVNGFVLENGESISLPVGEISVYARTVVGTADLRIMEFS